MPARILLVEDEIIVAKDIERMLVKQGYEVVGLAITGETALSMLPALKVDLALLDIQLPGKLSGLETAEKIRDLYRVPVVFMTSHSDDVTIGSAKKLTPYGYILKPINDRELFATLEMALSISSFEKQLRQSQTQLNIIINTTSDGVFITDHGKVVIVNDAFCKMSGYTREEIFGVEIFKGDEVENQEDLQRHIQELRVKGWDRFETQYHTNLGTVIDVEVSANLIPELNQSIIFVRDIQERKRSEQSILSLNQDLKRKTGELTTLYELERSQRELAETLLEIRHGFSSILDLDQILDLLINQIGRIVRNDICNIMQVTGIETRVLRSTGYVDHSLTAFIENYVFPLTGKTILDQIISSGKLLVVSDIQHDSRFSLPPGSAWLRSYIAVPIVVQNQVVALINVGTATPDFYQEWHAARLQAFAYQAAVAMQNARMYENAKKTAAQMEALSHRLLNLQENERRSIARELHDEIGQTLTAMQMRIEVMKHSHDAASFLPDLEEYERSVGNVLAQIRNLSLNLHPSVLDDLGLVPALRWLSEHEMRFANFSVHISTDSLPDRLPDWCEHVCYRIAQEALTNISRHAHAQEVWIELWQHGGELHLLVRDDGMGFDVDAAFERSIHGGSLGLIGMRERVTLVKGAIDIESGMGQGTEIHVRIPIDDCLLVSTHRRGTTPG